MPLFEVKTARQAVLYFLEYKLPAGHKFFINL
jgi:hypothetical protein